MEGAGLMGALQLAKRETPKAFAAFLHYCTPGPGRSIRLLAVTVLRDRRQLERWSSRNRWSERVQAFDAVLAPQVAGLYAQAVFEESLDERLAAQGGEQ
jgi:hypothetical protein